MKGTTVTESKTAPKKTLLDALREKNRATSILKINLGGVDYEWKLQAIPALEMDKLRAKHPATAAQRDENPNAVVNLDTYHPDLLANCSVDPELSYEEAKELIESPNLSPGEVGSIIDAAYQVNSRALGQGFTVSD